MTPKQWCDYLAENSEPVRQREEFESFLRGCRTIAIVGLNALLLLAFIWCVTWGFAALAD